MILRCVVAAINAAGEPDLFFVKVECTDEQYNDGEHYVAAKRAAEDDGYEPVLAYDEDDPAGSAMMSLFVWKSASTVEVRS